jgi:hypothetical protein
MKQYDDAKVDQWLTLARSLGDIAAPVVSKLSSLAHRPFGDGLDGAADAARFLTGIVPAPLKPVALALTLDLQDVVRSRCRD